MLKNLSDNLNMLMAGARLNSSELARQTGIPAGTIKRIKNNNANPTIETLIPLAKYFSIAISELVGDAPLNSAITIGLKKIPLLSWQKYSINNQIDYTNLSRFVLTERQIGKRGFALHMEKEYMDFFPKDSLLIVDPEINPGFGDYVIVNKEEQGIASIRKYICEIDHAYLEPLIKGLDIIPLTNSFKILGVIIQYKMELHQETTRI